MRGNVSAAAPRTPLVVLLAAAISGHHGPLAAVPQPAGMGCVRCGNVFYRFSSVLVFRAVARSRSGARSGADAAQAAAVRNARAGLERIGHSLGKTPGGLSVARRSCYAAGAVGAQRGQL